MDASTLQQSRDRAAREDFCGFVARVFGCVNPAQHYLHNWHIELIADYLAAAERGEITRLIINMPPRALKSICVSVAWPAWLLGHNPSRKIMAASYAQSLSEKHSQDCRLAMQSDWYRRMFPETIIARGENEKHKFVTTQRGMRMATSIFGSATGEGGNFLIADDPINPLQAMSHMSRTYVNEWFEHTFATRLDNKKRGVIVLVMQRLHAEDVSGYLLAKGGWELLSLPALAPEEQCWNISGKEITRAANTVLHEAREDVAQIEKAKLELGSATFAAQYQQNPLPESGGMVELDWFERF